MRKDVKRYIRTYFTFTRQETRGTIILVCIITLLVLYRFLHPVFSLPPLNNLNDVQILWVNESKKQLTSTYTPNDSLIAKQNDSESKQKKSAIGKGFYFNPNSISADSLAMFDISQKKISVLIKYRNTGATFKSADDLKKIYSFSEDDITKLRPWVMIPPAPQKQVQPEKITAQQKVVEKKPWYVDINTCDSAALVSLSGIGPVLASRILKYRNRFGAFRAKDQLLEITGITAEWYRANQASILLSAVPVKQLNINTCTLDELKRHAYFDYNIASILLNYRTHHGPFQSVSEIKNCAAIQEAFYKKVEAYLKVN